MSLTASRLARLVTVCSLAAAIALPATAGAQVTVRVGLPSVHIEVGAPLAPVAPGVFVIRDAPAEVFYVSGVYWTREDGRWYRARSPRSGWVYVEPRGVPVSIARMPPGQAMKAARQAAKHERKAEKEAWKAEKHAAKAQHHAFKAQAFKAHPHAVNAHAGKHGPKGKGGWKH